MTEFFKKNEKSIAEAVVAFFVWIGCIIASGKIFTNDPLSMGSLPMDYDAVPFMSILSKILALFAIFGFFKFIEYARKDMFTMPVFLVLVVLFLALLFISYPGYYMSDDALIFGYATRFLPVYWHNYLTSLYYMVAMTIIPASTAPIIMHCFISAMVFAYLYKKGGKIMLICAILPFTLLSVMMCFRPVIYAPVFLFFFAFLYYDIYMAKPIGKDLHLRVGVLSVLAAILCLWRSEGIVLLPFCVILLPLSVIRRGEETDIHLNGEEVVKKSSMDKVALALFAGIFVASYVLVRLPQAMGEEKYYGNDYLILATVRPLSLIVHEGKDYPEKEEDLENINKIVKLDYLQYETLSCTSFHRYNADKNSGSYTQTLASDADREKYIKSAARLIYKNLDVYLAERVQLFLVTNGIYGYDDALVGGHKQVETSEYALYASDRDYGEELIAGNQRIKINGTKAVADFLFKFGGEAYIPMLIVMIVTFIIAAIKKNGFIALIVLSLLARETLIFLTAPASFIQYGYPSMFVAAWAFIAVLLSRKVVNAEELE